MIEWLKEIAYYMLFGMLGWVVFAILLRGLHLVYLRTALSKLNLQAIKAKEAHLNEALVALTLENTKRGREKSEGGLH